MASSDYQKPAETLTELLDRNNIGIYDAPVAGRTYGGARSKLLCPQCSGGKQAEKNFFVSIDRDGYGAVWVCHRANNCGYTGGGRLKDAPDRPHHPPRVYRKPTPHPNPQLPPKTVGYFEAFGISDATVRSFRLYTDTRDMPVLDADGKQQGNQTEPRPVLAYPYFDGGELVNVKYKTIYPSGKKRFKQEYQCRPTLYNIDAFDRGDEIGIFVEGEDDVLAVAECGWHQVCSIPDGSPSKLKPIEEFDRFTDDDDRYRMLYGDPRLDRIQKWVLAGDMDEAGRRHHEELARRLGKEKCWQVRWPGGCKDAKETLKKLGREAVNHAIDTAIPYPLEGVYTVTDEAMLALRRGETEKRIITGMPALDERLSLRDTGSLIVTTGLSGKGKTTFWNAMSTALILHNDIEMRADPSVRPFHAVICSAEMHPEIMSARLMAAYFNQPFWDSARGAGMAEDKIQSDYLPWTRRHYSFIRWPDRGTQPSVTWLKNRLRELVRRTGAKLAIIDPWQEFDDEMPERMHNASKWIGKVLQGFVGLADELKCNIVIIVHPTKLGRDKDGKTHIPDGNDIADSVHFYSRCDFGLTVHRTDMARDEMMLRVWKTKDARFCTYGDTVLRFDEATFRLWPKPAEVDLLQTAHTRVHWND